VKFIDVVNSLATSSNLNKSVLSAKDPNSTARLIKFLSGSTGGVDYSILSNVLLSVGGRYKGIIDSYIAPPSYTYSTSSKILVSDAALYKNTNGIDPSCIIGKLIADGFLLSSSDIYVSGDSATESSSLVYLYKQEANGKTLTPAQKSLKAKLDIRNLMFFSAYIVEYCYYNTRYNFLLQQYFNVYTKPVSSYI